MSTPNKTATYGKGNRIPEEVKEAIRAACADGMTQAEAARTFGVSQPAVCVILGHLNAGRFPKR